MASIDLSKEKNSTHLQWGHSGLDCVIHLLISLDYIKWLHTRMHSKQNSLEQSGHIRASTVVLIQIKHLKTFERA